MIHTAAVFPSVPDLGGFPARESRPDETSTLPRGKPGRKCSLGRSRRSLAHPRVLETVPSTERERERDNLCYRTKKNHARDVDDNAIASCTTSSNDFSIVGVLNLSSLCPRLPFFFLFKPLRVSRTSLVRTKTGDPVYENYLIPPPGRNFILAKSVFFPFFIILSPLVFFARKFANKFAGSVTVKRRMSAYEVNPAKQRPSSRLQKLAAERAMHSNK